MATGAAARARDRCMPPPGRAFVSVCLLPSCSQVRCRPDPRAQGRVPDAASHLSSAFGVFSIR